MLLLCSALANLLCLQTKKIGLFLLVAKKKCIFVIRNYIIAYL